MRVKEIAVEVGYTFQPEQFHIVRGGYTIRAEMSEDDEEAAVHEALKSTAVARLKEVLLEGAGLHEIVTSSAVDELAEAFERGGDPDVADDWND